jgi:hypothetical protein
MEGSTLKTSFLMAVACLLLSGTVVANDVPPSDDSIREMLEMTNAHLLIDTVRQKMNAMAADQQKGLEGKTQTPERQAVLDRMHVKMAAALDEGLNWENMQAMYLRIYKASFTQDELDGMLAFYRTMAGQALINKMPLVTQNMITEMQGLMKPLQEKIGQIRREATQELKDLPEK